MFGFSRCEESLLSRVAEEVEAKIPTYRIAKGFQMLGCVVERQLHPQGQGQQSPTCACVLRSESNHQTIRAQQIKEMVGLPAVLTPEMLGSMGFLFCWLLLSVLLLFLLLPSLLCSQESFQGKSQNRPVGSRFPLLIFQSLGSTEPPQGQYEPLASVTCTFWNSNCSVLLCQAR